MCPITRFYTFKKPTITIDIKQSDLRESLIKDIETRYLYVISDNTMTITVNNPISIRALFYKYGITLQDKKGRQNAN